MVEDINFKKNIVLLIMGRLTSKFGVAFYLIVLPLFILKSSGSLAWSGIFFTLSSLPAIIVTPFLGIIVDRINKKNIIVICDLLAVILYIILLIAYNYKDFFLWILLFVTILLNVINNIFEIASKVLFTEIVPIDSIERYNGVKSFGDNAASIIAPVIGALLYGLWGFKIILLIMVFLYFISAVLEYLIKYNSIELDMSAKLNWFNDFIQGIHFVWNNKDILKFFILVMALNFFVGGSEEIMNPGILIQKYEISDLLFGFTSTTAIIGTIIAGIFIFKNQKIKLQKYMYYFIVINSILMIMTGSLSILLYPMKTVYFCLFLTIQLLIGFFTTCVNVPLNSYFQIYTPLKFQGRFFALLAFSASLFVPLGILYSGFISSIIGPDVTYIVNNMFIIFIIFLIIRKGNNKFILI
ncbi:MFS transporter [Lacrimispora algidixylanolytica]|uniref:Major facilitator superfamily (MFS) profile domain-containing protein n=1 Tax=Lacrimispora algidixylanolytica TaxID=94868 RepID=A0A419T334_9FIRM|nr:MFS transporter [Lacrimispora algidixylanolytica]RKD31818.1 hypothetical protein BET01_18780 [Lacrimispora algidixylanolytica]